MARDRRRKGEEKQTERIEVRLGVTQRDQFLAACKRAGDTPSDVLRAAMSSYIVKIQSAERKTLRQELTMKLIHNPLKTAGMALTSLAAFALIAAPSSADERLFKALDSNGDGVLTETDTAPLEKVIFVLDKDGSDSITLDEFRTIARYGRLFEPEKIKGKIDVSAKEIFVDNNTSQAEFSGDVDITLHPTDEHTSSTIVSLVTIDLTEPGEIRFKSENVTMEELSQVGSLDHMVIELEGDLLDRWPRKAAEVETP